MSPLKTETSVLTANDTTASITRLAEQIKTHPAYVQFVAAYHAMQADDECNE